MITFHNEISITRLFTNWKGTHTHTHLYTYSIYFLPWRWSALNMGFVVKWPCQPCPTTHMSVLVLQYFGESGSGHCTVSRVSSSYDYIYYLGGSNGTCIAAVATLEPIVRYYKGFSLLPIHSTSNKLVEVDFSSLIYFLFSGDIRPTYQRQSTSGNWPLGMFYVK